MTPARVGLTGGIGSGKTTASRLFARLGVPVLDLDRVGHRLLADERIARRIADAFGPEVLDGAGVDRARLAERAFAAPDALARLNAIMHPPIWAEAERWLRDQTAPYVVIEASVLIESGGRDKVDALIVVLADEEIRRRRLREKGLADARISAVMKHQCDDATRRRMADYLLDNNDGLRRLERDVERLHRVLLRRFGTGLDKTGDDT